MYYAKLFCSFQIKDKEWQQRFPCGSAGEEKRESLRTIDREGYKPHP